MRKFGNRKQTQNGPFVDADEANAILENMTFEFEGNFLVDPNVPPFRTRWFAPSGEPYVKHTLGLKLDRAWGLPKEKFILIAAQYFEELWAYAEARDGDYLFWGIRPTYEREILGRTYASHRVVSKICISRNATKPRASIPFTPGAALEEFEAKFTIHPCERITHAENGEPHFWLAKRFNFPGGSVPPPEKIAELEKRWFTAASEYAAERGTHLEWSIRPFLKRDSLGKFDAMTMSGRFYVRSRAPSLTEAVAA